MGLLKNIKVNSLGIHCLFSLLAVFCFSDISYAGQWIEQQPNEWYYIKDNGQYACNEMLFDDKGNLYSFDESSKMRSNTNYGNLSWDSSGAFVNRMAPDNYKGDLLKLKFENFKTNGEVTLDNHEDYIDFLNYSYSNYGLQNGGASCRIYSKSDKIIVTSYDNPKLMEALNLYDSYYEQFVTTVNNLRGFTDAETARNISDYISKQITYNIEKPNLITAISEGQGRCSTYSRYLNILCNIANIKCEEIYCYYRDGDVYHAINRVWYDNRWHYIDLTAYDAYGIYYDIPYNEFLNIYYLRDDSALFRHNT